MKKSNAKAHPATIDDIEELAAITNSAIQKATDPIYGAIGKLQSSVSDLQVDVSDLQADVKELRSDVKEIRDDVSELKQGQKRLEGGMQAILKVVELTGDQLREHRDLPERVARLERSVFR